MLGRVLLLRCEHHQGQVLAEARQEEQRRLRLTQADLLLQEGEAPHKGLASGEGLPASFPFISLANIYKN